MIFFCIFLYEKKRRKSVASNFDPNRRRLLKFLCISPFCISTLPLSGCVANVDTTNGEGRDVGEKEKEGERWRVVGSVLLTCYIIIRRKHGRKM